MSTRKTCLTHCLPVLLLAGCSAVYGGDEQTEEEGTAGSRNSGTVLGYCENFARKHAGNNAVDYQENSARIEKKSDIMMHISNLFSPSDSDFTSGYACHFQARKEEGPVQDISVGLFLTRTLHFAEYTQWEGLQVIPVEYVVDEANDRAGYGVFKYLENP